MGSLPTRSPVPPQVPLSRIFSFGGAGFGAVVWQSVFTTEPSRVSVQTPGRSTGQYGGKAGNVVTNCSESFADTADAPTVIASAPKQSASASVRRSIAQP